MRNPQSPWKWIRLVALAFAVALLVSATLAETHAADAELFDITDYELVPEVLPPENLPPVPTPTSSAHIDPDDYNITPPVVPPDNLAPAPTATPTPLPQDPVEPQRRSGWRLSLESQFFLRDGDRSSRELSIAIAHTDVLVGEDEPFLVTEVIAFANVDARISGELRGVLLGHVLHLNFVGTLWVEGGSDAGDRIVDGAEIDLGSLLRPEIGEPSELPPIVFPGPDAEMTWDRGESGQADLKVFLTDARPTALPTEPVTLAEVTTDILMGTETTDPAVGRILGRRMLLAGDDWLLVSHTATCVGDEVRGEHETFARLDKDEVIFRQNVAIFEETACNNRDLDGADTLDHRYPGSGELTMRLHTANVDEGTDDFIQILSTATVYEVDGTPDDLIARFRTGLE